MCRDDLRATTRAVVVARHLEEEVGRRLGSEDIDGASGYNAPSQTVRRTGS